MVTSGADRHTGWMSGYGGTSVTRPPVDDPTELSGLWNDIDARLIASEMSQKICDTSWIKTSETSLGRKPIIKFGNIIVRMDDGSNVNTLIFTNAMRKALLDTNLVTIKADTRQTRNELEDQANYAAKGKELAKEIAPDFIITGNISCQNDQNGREAIKFIVADFELINVETGAIIWTDRATPIKKHVSQSKYKP